MRRGALGGLVLALAAGPAPAQTQDCSGFDELGPDAALSIAAVADPGPRVNFIKNGSTAKGCPSGTEACRERAFLVPGDQVIVSSTNGAFACATYVSAKGLTRAGWLPATALRMGAEPAAVRMADWVATWTAPEQQITIKAARGGLLDVDGDATFGALDPERVKRGAVNMGQVSGTAKPEGAVLAFAMGNDDRTLPFDEGGEFNCRIRLRLVGSFLLAEDNRQCGGANVSFSGAYRRKK
jgi:hypothetical protein